MSNIPRVLGIEAVGLVEESPGGESKNDDIVATAIGGMGREAMLPIPACPQAKSKPSSQGSLGSSLVLSGNDANCIGLSLQVSAAEKE